MDTSDPQSFTPQVKSFDMQRAYTNLLEVYSLELQMYAATGNHHQLKSTYHHCTQLISDAIAHPRVVGLVKESGGKMHMGREWQMARELFYEAFRAYDECGAHDGRLRCLKYLILASMLAGSDVDPFESQETKPWRDNDDVRVMYQLIQAFQARDIKRFQSLVVQHRHELYADDYIRPYLQETLRSIRVQVLE